MTDTKKIIEITPINEIVAGHSVKVQVRLDEDATDQEILSSMDNACREWRSTQTIEMSLRLLVGRILIAVRTREIHKQQEWGSFEAFLMYIERRYGIKRSSCWNAMDMAAVPGVSVKRAKAIGPSNLLVVARAVRLAPERSKARLAEKLLAEADQKPPADEFKARLEHAKLLRTGRMRRRIARIILEVSPEIAEKWRELVGEQNSAEVFAKLIESALNGRRPMARAGAA